MRNRTFAQRGYAFLACLAVAQFVSAQSMKPSGRETYRPPEGYVPNELVAEQIAYAVLVPVYGKQVIDDQKPFKVTLTRGVWMVEGTFPKNALFGGTFEIEISKRDGRILRMIHYR
ncbi:YbbC/YhhH family protein [Massilia endophytica]|uniref:YbbC/YhhH family protein n=1 Tax=Massilia endophytica TaxID=2899220 RepID=UPI001E48D8AA|nr:YbbC/YhhH family protein [Massilia endophytica]UGQ46454.1 YbbC/YhhH family protein [Massilia endophytica]